MMIIYIENWDGVKVEMEIDIRIKEGDNIMVKMKISINRFNNYYVDNNNIWYITIMYKIGINSIIDKNNCHKWTSNNCRFCDSMIYITHHQIMQL